MSDLQPFRRYLFLTSRARRRTIQKKSSLEDGLEAYRHDRAIVHLIAADAPADYDGPFNYGVRADGTVVERPNEETHNSARGYDWTAIRWERVA